uniref:Uncharacterized protein n=1 Tax=Marseillevirus LCMAC103 TaxID=2506604 RepID=A0A481YW48_9VIRU|nr:MAG: uncharacterized protein LCMAC103_00650 [Marseillevirus LCMAC103]
MVNPEASSFVDHMETEQKSCLSGKVVVRTGRPTLRLVHVPAEAMAHLDEAASPLVKRHRRGSQTYSRFEKVRDGPGFATPIHFAISLPANPPLWNSEYVAIFDKDDQYDCAAYCVSGDYFVTPRGTELEWRTSADFVRFVETAKPKRFEVCQVRKGSILTKIHNARDGWSTVVCSAGPVFVL